MYVCVCVFVAPRSESRPRRKSSEVVPGESDRRPSRRQSMGVVCNSHVMRASEALKNNDVFCLTSFRTLPLELPVRCVCICSTTIGVKTSSKKQRSRSRRERSTVKSAAERDERGLQLRSDTHEGVPMLRDEPESWCVAWAASSKILNFFFFPVLMRLLHQSSTACFGFVVWRIVSAIATGRFLWCHDRKVKELENHGKTESLSVAAPLNYT